MPLINAIDKIHQYIVGGSPCDARLRNVRHNLATPVQRKTALELLKEWNVINTHGANLQFPLRRKAVVEYIYGKPIEEIDGPEALGLQRAVIDGRPEDLRGLNDKLIERHAAVNERALVLLSELNKRYAQTVKDELDKTRDAFGAAFADHGCRDQAETLGPVQRLASELERREAGGQHNMHPGGPADAFRDFGIDLTDT